jgi:hypothetical protein
VKRHGGAIPLADAAALRAPARTTLAVSAALALAAAGAALAFLLTSREPHTRTIVPLPSRGGALLVLDVSASISSDTLDRLAATLDSLVRGGGRLGLVVFSDQAYEALPPGTPAADLAPLVRYFRARKTMSGFAQSFPHNPWTTTFTGGTRISAGMELAHTIAVRGRPRTPLILISDLDDAPDDVPRLANVLLADRRDQVPVQIVGLAAAQPNVDLFRRLLGPSAPIVQAPTREQAAPHEQTPFPWTLVALVCLVAALLALATAWAPRLDWGRA